MTQTPEPTRQTATDEWDDPLEWLRQIGAPEGYLHEWERAMKAALEERDRLRVAMTESVWALRHDIGREAIADRLEAQA